MKYYIKPSGIYIELEDNIPVNPAFVEVPIPRPDDTHDWDGEKWVKTDRENMANKALREEAYKKESDKIFFKWQRGEATQEEWLDKVNEIKARYPSK